MNNAPAKRYLYVLRTNTTDEFLELEADDGIESSPSHLKIVNSFGAKIARVSHLTEINVGPDSRGGAVEQALSAGEQPVIVVDNLIKASRIFDCIKSVLNSKEKCVVGVSGPPGAGKSEFSAVLGSFFIEAGLPTYILSMDNYYHRTSESNMDKRCRLIERGGDYLQQYLGSQDELDLERMNRIATAFNAGTESIQLRKLDLLEGKLISEGKEQNFQDTRVLLVEGTWSLLIEPADIQIFIMSRPDLTLLRRIKRGREPITPELEHVIALEQAKLNTLCADADLIIYDDYFIEFPNGVPCEQPPATDADRVHWRLISQHGAVSPAQNPTSRELRTADEQMVEQPEFDLDASLERARATLHQMVLPGGIVASSAEITNYRRVWARDSVIAGLGGLLAGDKKVTEGLKQSVNLLARHSGPHGQLPSNVDITEEGSSAGVSYGGLAGRIDSISWYIIGVCHYGLFHDDKEFLNSHLETIHTGLALLDVWEFNAKGLVYMPQGGDWADEYIYHGYVLLPQLLRLWALQLYRKCFADDSVAEQIIHRRRLIEVNYWPLEENIGDSHVYHPHAFERYLESHREVSYFQASLNPTGYGRQYDFFGNAIAVLLQLGTQEQRELLLNYGQQVINMLLLKICPAFWPPVFEGDPEWGGLRANYRDKFSNAPFHYHNGGSWPMVTGWWGAALISEQRSEEAGVLLENLQLANALGKDKAEWEFNECLSSLTGEPDGITPCAWSASAPLFLHSLLQGDAKLHLNNPEVGE